MLHLDARGASITIGQQGNRPLLYYTHGTCNSSCTMLVLNAYSRVSRGIRVVNLTTLRHICPAIPSTATTMRGGGRFSTTTKNEDADEDDARHMSSDNDTTPNTECIPHSWGGIRTSDRSNHYHSDHAHVCSVCGVAQYYGRHYGSNKHKGFSRLKAGDEYCPAMSERPPPSTKPIN